MDKISTILIPFDFSESAKRALEYAVAFIGRNGDIKIILAYISGHSNFELLPENFTKLEKKYRLVLKNKMEWKIQGGSLTQSLLDIQKTRQIDLVIMGTLGSRMDGNSGETNTSKLVLAADCPVLVVPKGNIDFRMRSHRHPAQKPCNARRTFRRTVDTIFGSTLPSARTGH